MQPVSEALDRWNVIGAGVVVTFGPTFYLALHVTLWRAEIAEPAAS